MFYFFLQIIISFLILLFVFHLLNKKVMTVLEIILLLFVFNICMFSLYHEINILYMIFLSILVLLLYYGYKFLYHEGLKKKVFEEDKVFINRGIINFKELIKENYTYEMLLLDLKKRGIPDPSFVDYCIKKENDLIIFRKNSIKNYPISLIVDGTILKDNLFSIHKNLEWLDKNILENNLKLSDINYAYFKNQKVYFITN